MDFGVILGLGSLVVAALAVYLNWRKAHQDKKLAARADLEKEYRAPAERDAIIIGGAEQVVSMLRQVLQSVSLERDLLAKRVASLETQVTEREEAIRDSAARLRFLEHEVARLTKERGI